VLCRDAHASAGWAGSACGRAGRERGPAGAAEREARGLLAREHDDLDAALRPEAGRVQRAQGRNTAKHAQRAVVGARQGDGVGVRPRLHQAACMARSLAWDVGREVRCDPVW